MGHNLYSGVPFVSEEDMNTYRWQVARIHPRLPLHFLMSDKTIGNSVGEARVYFDPATSMWLADLYVNDYLSSWQLRDYRLTVGLEKKRITTVLLTQEKAADYNNVIGAYSGLYLLCHCGADKTSDPDHHMHFCPKYQKVTI